MISRSPISALSISGLPVVQVAGNTFAATLSAATGGLSAEVKTGNIFAANMQAATGGLSATFAVGSIYPPGKPMAAKAGLTASFLPGRIFYGNLGAAHGHLDAVVLTGRRFDALLSAAPGGLGAVTTSSGHFSFMASAAAGGLDAIAFITPPATSTAPVAWVVNLHTGGHACYTGKLDGSEPVAAKIITAATEFDGSHKKYVHDLYHNMRTDGAIKVTSITDEQKVYEGEPIESDGLAGIHRRRDKRAKGISGAVWQFQIDTVDGCDLTLKTTECTPIKSNRIAN